MTRWTVRLAVATPWLVALSCCAPQPVTPPPAPAKGLLTGPKAAPLPVKPGTVTRMTISSYFPLQQSGSALTFDVRPGIYYHLGHIPGAVSWPKGSYDSQLAARETELRAALQAKRPAVLYCTDRGCPDSTTVARRLAARGHSVAILEGGYEEWKAAELPIE